MAKTWSVAEAAKVIFDGNKAEMKVMGKRSPLASLLLASLDDTKEVRTLLSTLTFVTMRKLEIVLSEGVAPLVEEEEDDEEGITDPTEKKLVKEEKKAPRGNRETKKEEPVMNEPEDPDEEDDTPDLKKMSEVELFKLAKKKGLKPQPKKTKKYYIDLITKADEPTDESAEDDDWEEEPEEVLKKPAKKAPSKKAEKKAPAKKATEVEEDEEDDWDI